MPRRLHITAALMLAVCLTSRAQVAGHPDPLSLLASDDPALAADKRLVFDVWRGIVNAGHVELADELLAEGYTQHSPVLPTGRVAFKQIFSAVPRLDEIPELVRPPLVAMVAEEPYVVMALAETLAGADGVDSYTTAHFNLFRVENGRLAEHWHSVQTAPGPELAAPEDGGPQPVTGRVGTDQYALLEAADPALAANKRLVFDFSRQVVDAGREALAALYLGRDYVERSAAPGADGIASYYVDRADRPIAISLEAPLVAMPAEGDLVVQVTMQRHAHPSRAGETYTTTWFDMFRIADGRIVEHWDPATRAAPAAACAPDMRLTYLCGLTNAEDIVRVGTSRWLLASSITSRGETAGAGRLYLIDSEARAAEELFPGATPNLRRDAALYGRCAIDLQAFDTHGLALREVAAGRYRLYATSHGAIEAIQAFEVDATGARPSVAWVGCVPLPAGVWANSVAILDDGGFVTTQFFDPSDPGSVARIGRGEVNGAVYEWHPGGRVTALPGTALSGPNGVALSPDDRFLYVAAFGEKRVLRFDRGPDPTPPASVALDISPDNLRWTARGSLFTVGANAEAGTGWAIYDIDPSAMTAARVTGADRTASLQSVSTALEVGREIWIGTPDGDRVGYLPAP